MFLFEIYFLLIEHYHFICLTSLVNFWEIQFKFKIIIESFWKFFQFYTKKIGFYGWLFWSIFILFIYEIQSIIFVYILAPTWCIIACSLDITYYRYVFKIFIESYERLSYVKIFTRLEFFLRWEFWLAFFSFIKFIFG